jgi:hypothetical protein
MDVPTSKVGYTSATTGRADHEVHKGHVVELERERGDFPLSCKHLMTVLQARKLITIADSENI